MNIKLFLPTMVFHVAVRAANIGVIDIARLSQWGGVRYESRSVYTGHMSQHAILWLKTHRCQWVLLTASATSSSLPKGDDPRISIAAVRWIVTITAGRRTPILEVENQCQEQLSQVHNVSAAPKARAVLFSRGANFQCCQCSAPRSIWCSLRRLW